MAAQLMGMPADPASDAPVVREVTGASRPPLLSGELRDRVLDMARTLSVGLHAADTAGGRNASLASGYAGLAVCHGQLARTRSQGREDPDQRAADAARARLEEAVDMLATEPLTSSLYAGFPGIAWPPS